MQGVATLPGASRCRQQGCDDFVHILALGLASDKRHEMSHHLTLVPQARRANRRNGLARDRNEFVAAHLGGEVLLDNGESSLLLLDEVRPIAGTERVDTLVPPPSLARQHLYGLVLGQGGVHPRLLLVSALSEEDTNDEKPASILLPESKLQVFSEFILQAHGTS